MHKTARTRGQCWGLRPAQRGYALIAILFSVSTATTTTTAGREAAPKDPIAEWVRPIAEAKTFDKLEQLITPVLFVKDRATFQKMIRAFPPSASPQIEWKDGKLHMGDGTETVWLRPTNFEYARFEINGGIYQWVPWEMLEDQISVLRKPPYVVVRDGTPQPPSEKILTTLMGSLLYVMKKQSDQQGRKVQLTVDTRAGKQLGWTCERIRGEIESALRSGEKVPEEKLRKVEQLQSQAVRNTQNYCDGSANRQVACQQARELLECSTQALGLRRKSERRPQADQ